jgi:hypothetical protein
MLQPDPRVGREQNHHVSSLRDTAASATATAEQATGAAFCGRTEHRVQRTVVTRRVGRRRAEALSEHKGGMDRALLSPCLARFSASVAAGCRVPCPSLPPPAAEQRPNRAVTGARAEGGAMNARQCTVETHACASPPAPAPSTPCSLRHAEFLGQACTVRTNGRPVAQRPASPSVPLCTRKAEGRGHQRTLHANVLPCS